MESIPAHVFFWQNYLDHHCKPLVSLSLTQGYVKVVLLVGVQEGRMWKGGRGGQHDPGILRTRVRKLRKVAQHATSKRALEAPKGCKRYNLCKVTKSLLHCCLLLTTMLISDA